MGSLCTPTTARATLATFFFFNDTATTEIYTLSLHDALPISQFDEADITDLEAFRKAQTVETEKQGFKLTMLAFMIKACVTALRQYPVFNSSLDRSGESIVIKKYFHIGVAVDTPGGLVVPVVRDADRKGVFDLAHELADIDRKSTRLNSSHGYISY